MTENKLLINNLGVNYKIAGEGPAILILHGWGGSSDSWRAVQEILARKGYSVVVPDFPGFGKSVPPPSPWTVGDYMEWLVKLISEVEIKEPFFLLGHSFGGRIAIKFSIKYPDKVRKLILCDSAGIKPKMGPKALLIFWIARIGNAIFTPKHLERFKDSLRNLFYIFLRNRDYVKAKGVMKDTIVKVLEEDLLPELSSIKKETLLVWGEADKMVPLRDGRMFNEKIAGSTLKILPKIGHSPHLEVPEELSEIISSFFKQ